VFSSLAQKAHGATVAMRKSKCHLEFLLRLADLINDYFIQPAVLTWNTATEVLSLSLLLHDRRFLGFRYICTDREILFR
jgi:hypothetical protein